MPRLCTQYHNKVKGLTDQEQNVLLEKLYNEWYDAIKEARQASTENSKTASLDHSIMGSELRPLAKIEETLLDRSVNRSKLSGKQSGR